MLNGTGLMVFKRITRYLSLNTHFAVHVYATCVCCIICVCVGGGKYGKYLERSQSATPPDHVAGQGSTNPHVPFPRCARQRPPHNTPVLKSDPVAPRDQGGNVVWPIVLVDPRDPPL